MYSPKVVESKVAALRDRLGINLTYYDPGYVEVRVDLLEKIQRPDGKPSRRLTKPEQEFILNEMRLCRLDFAYWVRRYCIIALDGGGIGKLKFARSQEVALYRHFAPAEEKMHEMAKQGAPVTGLLFYWHKARQLYATALSRAMLMHRFIFLRNRRALSASVDNDKILELYDRDKLIWENLPWWMKGEPELTYDVKGEHLYCAALRSRMLYQVGTQKSGMGQGRQFDDHHLTECAYWDSPETQIDYVLNPAIPDSINTLGIRESNANGRGNWWHNETEAARFGRSPKWNYIFMPWYIVSTKYRMRPPSDDWRPQQTTILHAEMVARTSPEFCGETVKLTREQMYWYEVNRSDYQRRGQLNLFYTSYPSTPEESFQHTGNSAFSVELLEDLRLHQSKGAPFDVAWDDTMLLVNTPVFKHQTTAFAPAESTDGDGRGTLYVWQAADPRGHYVIGCDPTVGLHGWSRWARTQDDYRTDNAAIEVVRVYPDRNDEQVAEYAAPINPMDLAHVLAALGRYYKGASEYGEALLIIEVYPGPGLVTYNELVHRYGYTNFWYWKYIDRAVPTPTNNPGWYASSLKAQQALWIKGHHYIAHNGLKLNSPFLIEEMTDCELDPVKMRGKAMYGKHDDRVYALLMSMWAAHDWALQIVPEVTKPDTTAKPQAEAQARDVSMRQMYAEWEEAFSNMLEEGTGLPT